MISVLKADGSSEPFDEHKVKSSIGRAGIPKQLHDTVLKHVESKLYDHITTQEIYHHITEFLGNSEHPYTRAKYSLKQAIMLLGPTGYPFEDFIAEILKAEGYGTEVRQILQGKCISHEVDVVAKKDGQTVMVEVKFHNTPGLRTDTHVALYTNARYEDLRQTQNFTSPFLVTNTKVTTDVEKYGLCANVLIMSWGYPEGKSLRDLIEKYKLYPITALTNLNQSQKQTLLNNHIVLCKDLVAKPEAIDLLFLSNSEEKQKILEEARCIVQL